ncbi:hypothetical protein THMIRHAS_19420 [Thiosulfatimonas sediminis]|uniref:Penicillin-binding protein activator n=1 Tax=Thiosulfatimonas sediminis TaxID=2675054 RepID=A0A6F8PWS2_9GAMM|nr:penicillin-binding protein activator [Thiosulfatimonas sediminis]BBP46569.1 hypothetical protein THMIRHAS_19420 [Thiosulfatimonas sediminis]
MSNPANSSHPNALTLALTACLGLSLTLSGCSTPAPAPVEKKPPVVVPEEPKVVVTPIKPMPIMTAIDPEEERQKALAAQDWQTYLQFSDDLWQDAPEARKIQLETEIWQTLLPLDDTTLALLENSRDMRVDAWAHLVRVFRQQGLAFKQGLQNLNEFEQDAIYQAHLLPQLLAQLPSEKRISQIAVFLPLNSKFKPVAEQVQRGILKAFYQNSNLQNQLQIRFYDSSDESQVSSLYFQAKQDGADVVIGPLRKSAIEQLQGFDDPYIIALNEIGKATPFPQFSLKSSDKIGQMTDGFVQQQYQNIGIINSDSPEQSLQASLLINAWSNPPFHTQTQVTYSNEKPRLREAFDQLLNAEQSTERKNVLSRSIGEKLDFYPRVRQDLDAVVVFDSAQRLAVINPQKALYLLDIPIYGATSMSRQDLATLQNNRDLKQTIVLTQPLVLNPQTLNSAFEAFGWDALMLATNLGALQQGGCLSNTKTGQLSLIDNKVVQALVWAKFDDQGQLQAYQLPQATEKFATSSETESNMSDAEQDLQLLLRQEMLQNSQQQSITP